MLTVSGNAKNECEGITVGLYAFPYTMIPFKLVFFIRTSKF